MGVVHATWLQSRGSDEVSVHVAGDLEVVAGGVMLPGIQILTGFGAGNQGAIDNKEPIGIHDLIPGGDPHADQVSE